MSTESYDAVRDRLLRDPGVQQMIRSRAYEIYLLRGRQPGGEAHDWFQAENEVLAFLIAGEAERAEAEGASSSTESQGKQATADKPAPKRRKSKSSEQSQSKKVSARPASARRAAARKKSERKPTAKQSGNHKKDPPVE